MKGTVYYCDRCYAEGVSTPAGHKAWIRTTLGGHALKVDVCEKHLAIILGSNGAAPPTPAPGAPRTWSERGGKQLERKAYERLAPFVDKRPRFTLDDAKAYLGKDVRPHRVTKALNFLVEDGKLERYQQGVYQRPGFTMPEPESPERAAAAIVKLAKAQPGILATAVAAFAGIESQRLWKATLEYLREHKLARTKGAKSAMRVYPV